jgi:hypothetical protein
MVTGQPAVAIHDLSLSEQEPRMTIFSTVHSGRRRWLAVSFIVAVTLIAAAIGGASVVGPEGDQALITGGTPDQKALAAKISSGVDVAKISRVDIGPPPDGFAASPEMGEFGTTWLTVFVDAPTLDDGGTVIPQWASQLVVGEFRDLSHRRGMPEVLGSSVVYQLPNGSQEFGGSFVIAAPLDDDVDSVSEAATDNTIRARVSALRGLKDISVSFQHPNSIAAVVTESASDVRALLATWPSLAQATFGDFRRASGGLLVVKDGQGKLVSIGAFSTRTGIGTSWTDPEYSDLGGVSGPRG